MRNIFYILSFCLTVSLAWAIEGPPSLTSLVDSELQFAQTAVDKGVKTAFLEFLSNDSILFRPRAVSGKEWMEGRPPSRDLLIWRPAYAEVSAAGDLGFTTGPWEFSRATGGDPIGYGQFLSIWKKQTDGTWKLALDTGTEHPKPEVSVFEVQLATRHSSAPNTSHSPKSELEKSDRSLSEAWEKVGEMALENFIQEDTLILRNDRFPGRGLQAMKERVDSNARNWKVKTDKVFLSSSGDLGYSYGSFERGSNGPSGGTFVRIWRKEQDWKVAVDLTIPDPQ